MRHTCIAILLLFLSLAGHAREAPVCASTIAALRGLTEDPLFSSTWAEISMDDGKPLVVLITERNGALSLKFVKAGEGLWADISGVICKTGVDLELRTAKGQVELGPAANWMLGVALANGGVFTMRRAALNQLQIETQGWSGLFAPTAID